MGYYSDMKSDGIVVNKKKLDDFLVLINAASEPDEVVKKALTRNKFSKKFTSRILNNKDGLRGFLDYRIEEETIDEDDNVILSLQCENGKHYASDFLAAIIAKFHIGPHSSDLKFIGEDGECWGYSIHNGSVRGMSRHWQVDDILNLEGGK